MKLVRTIKLFLLIRKEHQLLLGEIACIRLRRKRRKILASRIYGGANAKHSGQFPGCLER